MFICAESNSMGAAAWFRYRKSIEERGRLLIYLIAILTRKWQGSIEGAGGWDSTDSYEGPFNVTEEIRFL